MIIKERPLEPQESKYKCYKFKGVATCIIEGYVWAKDAHEAEELGLNREYEEIDDYEIDEIHELEELKEY